MPSGDIQSRPNRRAIVIGGSIASLFVGAFLRRIGWRVDIYERSSIELIGRGVGIFASQLELFEALDKCGASTIDIGVIAYKRITFDRKGDVIPAADRYLPGSVAAGATEGGARGVTPDMGAPIRLSDNQVLIGSAIISAMYSNASNKTCSGVRAHFANGGSARADLLVACDVFRSTVRAQAAPEVQPIYSGYFIWRGAPNESDTSSETRRTMFSYFSFFLADRLEPLGYPNSGSDDELRDGCRRYNFGR